MSSLGPLVQDLPGLTVRGAGRSYGDAALNGDGGVIDVRPLDRFLGFDLGRGILRVEAGATVEEVLRLTIPRGWFLPVVPGTCHPTMGGLFAADVHGKNHHGASSFQRHVRAVTLILASGEKVVCSREERPELFAATAGGMGLTGIIAELEIQLRSIQNTTIHVHEKASSDLDGVIAGLEEADGRHEYSVAWIDGLARGARLGRGTVLGGDHARPEELESAHAVRPLEPIEPRERGVPPGLRWFLDAFNVRIFNAFHHARARRRRRPYLESYAKYFFPLDGLRNWNHLYSKGFLQYQCVVPFDGGPEFLQGLLEQLQQAGHPSYLIVLKRFGEGFGMLSFPMPGWTIALDLPVRPGLDEVLDRVDADVAERGGRVYLAKDARLSPEMMPRMYSELDAWLEVKRAVDPEDRFTSDLARRLGLSSRGGTS